MPWACPGTVDPATLGQPPIVSAWRRLCRSPLQPGFGRVILLKLAAGVRQARPTGQGSPTQGPGTRDPAEVRRRQRFKHSWQAPTHREHHHLSAHPTRGMSEMWQDRCMVDGKSLAPVLLRTLQDGRSRRVGDRGIPHPGGCHRGVGPSAGGGLRGNAHPQPALRSGVPLQGAPALRFWPLNFEPEGWAAPRRGSAH